MIRDIMKANPVTVRPEQTLQEVAQLLIEKTVSGFPVVNEQNELVGVISEKDVFGAVFPSYREFYVRPQVWVDYDWSDVQDRLRAQTVSDAMVKKVFTALEDDPILKVGAMMLAHHIHRVPVVKDGKLVGIVTRKDIYRSLLRKALAS